MEGADIKFADFDLTLTDRELEDFLSFMEHQVSGLGASVAQLPDAAMDFPGLQLQPHSGSPSNSEGGSESMGVELCDGGQRRATPLAPSDGSLTTSGAGAASPAHDPAAAAAASPSAAGATASDQLMQQQELLLQAASAMDVSSAQTAQQLQPQPLSPPQQQLQASLSLQQQPEPQAQPMEVKLEPGCEAPPALLLPLNRAQLQASSPLQAAACCAGVGSCSPGGGAPSLAAPGGDCTSPVPGTALSAAAVAAAASQPQQLCMSMPPVQWPAPGQAVPQLLFVQPMQLSAAMQQAQAQAQAPPQQQQQAQQQAQRDLCSRQASASSAALVAAQAAAASAGLAGRRQHSEQPQPVAAGSGSGGGGAAAGGGLRSGRASHGHSSHAHHSHHRGAEGKAQVSHSTVEKQRRDRLNSLIDELSDIVPPADPKYGGEATSVRRPKHVVLADTINLLRAMQTKLQIEEAEICTLKQQAAVAATMAAQQHVGQASGPVAAEALLSAAAGGHHPAALPPCGAGAAGAAAAVGNGGLAGAGDSAHPELPLVPDSGVASTGVLVEQGIGCLYVKVNCRDRKGLLSDVVSALKALPLVISTAAITTTKDGKVHDVFEVRPEDESVNAEDIQCAVHLALFAAERARSKRLRPDGPGSGQE